MKWLWPIVTEYHGQEFSTVFIIRFQISAPSPALGGDGQFLHFLNQSSSDNISLPQFLLLVELIFVRM
jgi:hypothetical protein